ncbi:MAG: Bro-N domain-containing protein [Treponema sp.]|nr:Bro-N domain-containing protein [Treponema sp.]
MKTTELARSFNGREVRVVVIDGAEWFVARDVCDILDIQNASQALADFPNGEKGISTIYTPGGNQEASVVNEPGLYRLVFKSRKPEAEAFKTWVFSEVLPSIRRTGKYDTRDIRGKSKENRNMVTRQWQRQGVKAPVEYAMLTKEEYLRLYGDPDKKKSDMDRQDTLKLAAFESVEAWKLSEIAEGSLGFGGCRKSIGDTARLLDDVAQSARLGLTA